MNIIGIIPARLASSRLPNKPLADILGMPMIGHVYHRSKMSNSMKEVYVATCDDEIYQYIESIGGKAVMTSNTMKEHPIALPKLFKKLNIKLVKK